MADLPGQFEFSCQKSWFCLKTEWKKVENCWFDNFWRENSNYNRTQCIINHNNSLVFGTKIQIHNFAIFSENEFLDTIWDFLTVCLKKIFHLTNIWFASSICIGYGHVHNKKWKPIQYGIRRRMKLEHFAYDYLHPFRFNTMLN